MSELLQYDESRVNSILARLKSLNQKANNTSSSDESSKAAKLPATQDNPGGVGNYVVTVGLGTPENKLDLIFDTGSSITWTQCQPCRSKQEGEENTKDERVFLLLHRGGEYSGPLLPNKLNSHTDSVNSGKMHTCKGRVMQTQNEEEKTRVWRYIELLLDFVSD